MRSPVITINMKPRPLFLLVLVVLVLLLDDFLLWRTIFEGFAILIPAGYGWYVVCECIGCTLHVPLVAILSCLANINVGVEITRQITLHKAT
jgi:hypothetical protein